jgi:hypothetical protein
MSVVPYDQSARAVAARPGVGFDADWLLDPAEIANRIGGTDFVPKALRNNPAAITAALLYGAEVGLGPMQSLAKIAVIDGRPALAAEAQRALILHAGHELFVEESTNSRCTIGGRRRDSDTTSRVTWTLDDAKRAKISGRPAWQAYPRQMLLARASAELARAIFADVIGGMPALEELDDVDTLDPSDPETPRRAAAQADADAAKPKPATRRRKRTGATIGEPSSSSSSPADVGPVPGSEPGVPVADALAAEAGPPADSSSTKAAKAEPEPAGHAAEPEATGAAGEPADPDGPNKAQLGMLFALFNEKGITERDERLAWSERELDRKISSSKELSSLDVSRLIEALKALEPAKPAAAPEPADELPADEQAVLDALATELDGTEVSADPDDDPFPEGY